MKTNSGVEITCKNIKWLYIEYLFKNGEIEVPLTNESVDQDKYHRQ